MGWVIGYIAGAVVVVVVASLVLALTAHARRIAGQTAAIVSALELARDRSSALWAVQTTNATAERIVLAAADARVALSGGENQ
ncbi:MAG: hypothetical protein ACYCO3_07515 [Mycobacteriales bacterium]